MCPGCCQSQEAFLYCGTLVTAETETSASQDSEKDLWCVTARVTECYTLRAWQYTRRGSFDGDRAWNYRTTLLVSVTRWTAAYHVLSRQTRTELAQAKQNYVNIHIEGLREGASASEILHGVRPVIGTSNLRKRKGTSLPLVAKDNGEPCETGGEIVDRWADFFCAMEGGTRMDATQQREHWLQGLQELQAPFLELSITDLPTLFDLESAFRHVKCGKATGHDLVPSEICHYFPTVMAHASYTQLAKLCLHGQECLSHKGGETSDIIQKGTSGLLLELQVPAHFLPHWEDPAQNLKAVPMHSVPELHADSTTWREIKNTRWICKPHVQSASKDSGHAEAMQWIHLP